MTRQWVEQARKAGQTSGPAAADGTFAAGVNHVTELLPSFMTDIINTAPEEQKVRFLEISLNTIVSLDHTALESMSVNALLPLYTSSKICFPICICTFPTHVFIAS